MPLKRFLTPMLAGQTDGELWLVASYPLEPLLVRKPGSGVPDEWGRALDFIPFVEVYTYNHGECCIVDVFADAKAMRHPHRSVTHNEAAGFMRETIVRMEDVIGAAWGRANERVTRWALSKPISYFISPETGPLTLYRYRYTQGYEPPGFMQRGSASRQGGWTPHAVVWLEHAVGWVVNAMDRPIKLVEGHTLTNMGELPYAEVAQYFIDKGERGFER